MDNQHRKIATYRELNQNEIDLMNSIKSHAALTEAMVRKVRTHIQTQRRELEEELKLGDSLPLGRVVEIQDELDRLDATEPARWLAEGKTDLQKGLMSLTRAVAQPTGF